MCKGYRRLNAKMKIESPVALVSGCRRKVVNAKASSSKPTVTYLTLMKPAQELGSKLHPATKHSILCSSGGYGYCLRKLKQVSQDSAEVNFRAERHKVKSPHSNTIHRSSALLAEPTKGNFGRNLIGLSRSTRSG